MSCGIASTSPAEVRKFTTQKRKTYFPAITAFDRNASTPFSMPSSSRRFNSSRYSSVSSEHIATKVLRNLTQRRDAKVVRDRFQLGVVDCQIAGEGRRAIGWDEILYGVLAPGAAVTLWRGVKGGIAAAAQRHDQLRI